MSDTPNTPNAPEAVEPRELTAIIADLTTARKLVEDLPAGTKTADRKSADESVQSLQVELKEAKRGLVFAEIASKQAEYDKPGQTAGVKAALRRDMNNLRKKVGLPEQIAGSKSSGPRFSAEVLAILESDEDLS